MLTRAYTHRFVKGTVNKPVFWIPSKQLLPYTTLTASTPGEYRLAMLEWLTGHRLDSFLKNLDHVRLSSSSGGLGVLLLDQRTRAAKLVDGRKRLWCTNQSTSSTVSSRDPQPHQCAQQSTNDVINVQQGLGVQMLRRRDGRERPRSVRQAKFCENASEVG